MLTVEESRPLRHLRMSGVGVAVGALMFIAGLWVLFTRNQHIELAIALLSLGAGLASFASYYWGCANNACTPEDS